jgi:hypothetical protein
MCCLVSVPWQFLFLLAGMYFSNWQAPTSSSRPSLIFPALVFLLSKMLIPWHTWVFLFYWSIYHLWQPGSIIEEIKLKVDRILLLNVVVNIE